jgi:hypothetical protein
VKSEKQSADAILDTSLTSQAYISHFIIRLKGCNQALSRYVSAGFTLVYSPRHDDLVGVLLEHDGVENDHGDVLDVAVQVAFRKQSLKPVSHSIGPMVETRRF